MTDKTSLGNRMKAYEVCASSTLTPRMPKILRVDGKAFHSYIRGFEKPWDDRLILAMNEASIGLLENIQGAVLTYTQSDEISVLIVDCQKLESQCWFGGKAQKMISVGASIATAYFNKSMYMGTENFLELKNPALFDARVFCIPESDVTNYFLWRQRDAERNSIQGLAQKHFSHKSLHGLNTKKLVQKLEDEKGLVWGDLPVFKKRGWCNVSSSRDQKTHWVIPRFSENRDFIESLLPKKEENEK